MLSGLFTDCCKKTTDIEDKKNIPSGESKLNWMMPTESDGSQVEYDEEHPFSNWGETVKNTPRFRFYPKTKQGVANIVKLAKHLKKRVRVSGFKHSWSQQFSEDDQILISMLPRKESDDLPVEYPLLNNNDELRGIHPVGDEFKDNDGKIKKLFKLGPAITNQQLRIWAIDAFERGEIGYCFAKNVVMEENTVGGIISNMCHGAGIRNKTVSDDVVEIEFINAKGELQTINDPELLKSVAGSFGLFGVITNVTVKLERMPHVRMEPKKTPLSVAIPPPADYKLSSAIPPKFFIDFSIRKQQEAEAAFIKRCEQSDYEEEFWFPGEDEVWINAWNENGDAKESKDYPGKCKRQFEAFEEYVAGLANDSILKLVSSDIKTEMLSKLAMLSLPVGNITTPKVDALHFRGGVQNMQVQDMEFEIGIPRKSNGKLDWSIVQRAWWDAMTVYYEFAAKNQFPMQLPLEMRIMGGSDITMAAQRGNEVTCSIEVLTVKAGLVDPMLWKQFMQAVADKWASYTDFRGKPLQVIPHIAKQWEGLTIQRPGEKRMDMETYFKKVAFKEAITLFNKHREQVAKLGGYSLKEMNNLFSNSFWDRIFNGAKKLAKPANVVRTATVFSHPQVGIKRTIPESKAKGSKTCPDHVVCAKTAEMHLRQLFENAKKEREQRDRDIQAGIPAKLSGTAHSMQRLAEAKQDLCPEVLLAPMKLNVPDEIEEVVEIADSEGFLMQVNFWKESPRAAGHPVTLETREQQVKIALG